MPSIWLWGGFEWLCPGWPRWALPTSRFRWLRLLPSAICLPLPGCSIETSGIPGEIPCVHGQARRMVDLPVRRLGLHCVLPAPTVCCLFLPGAAPAYLPCGSRNLLGLLNLWANSCTLGLTIKVCDLLVLPLTVLPAVASRARLHRLAMRGSPFPVLGQSSRAEHRRAILPSPE